MLDTRCFFVSMSKLVVASVKHLKETLSFYLNDIQMSKCNNRFVCLFLIYTTFKLQGEVHQDLIGKKYYLYGLSGKPCCFSKGYEPFIRFLYLKCHHQTS